MDLVFVKEKNIVIIEMNSSYSKSGEIKARQYLYRKASTGFDKGDTFNESPKVKLIMFNNYLNRDQKDMKVVNYILCNPELDLKYDDIEIYEIYLPLYHKLCYDKYGEMDKRLWLFTASSFKEMKETVKEEETIKIIKELERLSMNNKFKDEYDYENVQRKLINSAKSERYEDGLKDGMQAGANYEKIEVAKKLLSEKIDINIISKVTNLPISEINLLV